MLFALLAFSDWLLAKSVHPRRFVFPHLSTFLTYLARITRQIFQATRFQLLIANSQSLTARFSAPLFSCSGASRGDSVETNKNPDCQWRHIGTALAELLGSSSGATLALDVAPFPSHRRSRLLMRRLHSATSTIRHCPPQGNQRSGARGDPTSAASRPALVG